MPRVGGAPRLFMFALRVSMAPGTRAITSGPDRADLVWLRTVVSHTLWPRVPWRLRFHGRKFEVGMKIQQAMPFWSLRKSV